MLIPQTTKLNKDEFKIEISEADDEEIKEFDLDIGLENPIES